MQVESAHSMSVSGIVAAWAGSIALHAAVIVALHGVAPPLAPVPAARAELQVAVIESVRFTPPEIRSNETAGADALPAVTRPSLRMTPLTQPVVADRAQDIRTAPAPAVETRPAPRGHERAARATGEGRRSVGPTRRVDSVRTDVVIRRKPAPLTQEIGPAGREAETASSTVVPRGPVDRATPVVIPGPTPNTTGTTRSAVRTVAPAETRALGGDPERSTRITTAAPVERRQVDVRTPSQLLEGESVVAFSSPASVAVRSGPGASSRRTVETRPEAPPLVVEDETGPRGVRVLEHAPAQVRAGPQTESVSVRPVEHVVPVGKRVQRVRPRPRSTGAAISSISDYGWLADAMHRRIAELKQYPQRARVNRWEGRVVLRAVIRDDGELAALSVRTSSGHHALDEEAMKLVRQVCPVPLTHPLGRPEITLHIPITYTLDR